MSDLISRQAAIDEVSKYASIWMEYDADMTQEEVAEAALNAAKRTMVHILEEMPSARSEIIRCRECKFASGDSRICMKFDHSPIGELDFCAWAERRTDE